MFVKIKRNVCHTRELGSMELQGPVPSQKQQLIRQKQSESTQTELCKLLKPGNYLIKKKLILSKGLEETNLSSWCGFLVQKEAKQTWFLTVVVCFGLFVP